MQDNTITLDVNTDNDDGTTATVEAVFTRFEEYLNRSVYIHSNHTLGLRETLNLYRTLPKPSGNFRGTAKSAVKFTKDYSVPGNDAATTIVAPSLGEASFSFPVGMTPAQTLEQRMRLCALILLDSVMVPLTDQLMV